MKCIILFRSKQVCIENELKNENQNYSGEKMAYIQEMMETITIYKEKLVNIKKQMTTIHQRTNNLKVASYFFQN